MQYCRQIIVLLGWSLVWYSEHFPYQAKFDMAKGLRSQTLNTVFLSSSPAMTTSWICSRYSSCWFWSLPAIMYSQPLFLLPVGNLRLFELFADFVIIASGGFGSIRLVHFLHTILNYATFMIFLHWQTQTTQSVCWFPFTMRFAPVIWELKKLGQRQLQKRG